MSRVMRALLGRSFSRSRGLLLSLAGVLVVFQVLVVIAAAYLEEQRSFTQIALLMPPAMQQVMGGIFSSFSAMVAFGYFHPIVIIVYVGLAVVVASEPAADVESGVVDIVLARPIPRAALVARSLAMTVLITLGMAALMVAATKMTMIAATPAGTPQVPMHTLLRLATNLIALSWCVGAFSLAVSAALTRRGAAAGAVGVVALAVYLLNVLAEIWPRLRPYGPVSPFHYYQPMSIVTGLGPSRWAGDVTLLAGVAMILWACAFVAFARRDV